MMKNRKANIILSVCLILVVIIGIGSFISGSKFGVMNPFSTAIGLLQVVFTDKEYVEIQQYPKVIVAKPNASLRDYMQRIGFQEDSENQMGALHVYRNKDAAQYVRYSANGYFAKWIWQE